MSDEIFNFINTQFKQTGTAYWACRPCTAYAQGMNHRVKQLEEEMEEIEMLVKKTTVACRRFRRKWTNWLKKLETLQNEQQKRSPWTRAAFMRS
jgi:hypothetical protein